MSERFYVNLPLTPGPVILDGAEARHLASACRLRPGDAVCLFNGDGREYPARVVEAGRREVRLEITSVEEIDRELPFRLEVAAPPPKGDRCQFLVEKLTELGAAAYVPLTCRFSNLHPRDLKTEKMERWVIEASKQCRRNRLMEIMTPANWDEYCRAGSAGEIRILAHPVDDVPSAAMALPRDLPGGGMVRVAVGPEGGFSDDEAAAALSHGWQTVRLGPRILRVETAAVALTALLAR